MRDSDTKDILFVPLKEKIFNLFFWLKAGLTWRDRFRLLWFWLSPYFRGHCDHLSAPVQTAYLSGRHILFRAFSTDVRVFRRIFNRECYALPLTLVRNISTVVDLGANSGFSTIFFAERYPTARILAVEPDPNAFKSLESNVQGVPGQPRITTLNVCLADKTGETSFSPNGPSDGRRINDKGTGLIKVHSVTMLDLLARGKIVQVDLLKMDIEGAEAMVFKSVSGWLDRIRWIIVEVHFDFFSLNELKAAISSTKRRLFVPAGHKSRHWLELDEILTIELPKLASSIDVLISPDQEFDNSLLTSY